MQKYKKILAGLMGVFLLFVCFRVEYYTYKLQSEETALIEESQPVASCVTEENQKEKEKKEQKVAYLTFDDGPSCNTKRVLDVLNA